MGWFERAERSEAQVEAEIAAELEFHLEQRARQLAEQGLDEEQARAEAERRFGSLERVRRECRWVQMGERIMLQRIQLALNVVLASAVAVLGWSFWQSNAHTQDQLYKLSALLEVRAAELAPQDAPAPDPLIERFRRLEDPSAAATFASELASREPASGSNYMQEGWWLVQDPQLRIALLAPFVDGGGHACAIQILHLAATDPVAAVREQAFLHLKHYAWRDFKGKPQSIYHEWYADVRAASLGDALSRSAERYSERLRASSGPALVRELELIEEIDLEPALLRGRDVLHDLWWSGGEDNLNGHVEGWLRSEDPRLQLAALRFVAHFPREAEAQSDAAIDVLAGADWKDPEQPVAACRALGACPQIPLEPYSALTLRLLRLCVESDTPDVRRHVGEGFLARLWRLAPDPERGAPQWVSWWKENRDRFEKSKLLEGDHARWLDAR